MRTELNTNQKLRALAQASLENTFAAMVGVTDADTLRSLVESARELTKIVCDLNEIA